MAKVAEGADPEECAKVLGRGILIASCETAKAGLKVAKASKLLTIAAGGGGSFAFSSVGAGQLALAGIVFTA